MFIININNKLLKVYSGADPGISVRGGAMMDDTGDHLSGAPPLVGAERTRKFWDFDTPQIIGNGTFELEIADLL